jgi:penicillin-binding protein 1A
MKLCNRFTTKASFDFLTTKLGFTSLVESDKRDGKLVSDINPASMSLGALTDGATLLEMAAGYVPIMNGGVYYEPTVYTKVYDSKGKLLLEKKPYSEQVVSAETAYITNRLLSEVIYGPHGTASNASMGGGIPVIGKTGTTESYHDRLFIGMTPNYLGAVWIGYDQPRPVDVYRISNPARVWRMVMQDVMRGVKVDAFPVSKSVVRMEYCAKTGLLAGDGCGERLIGYYKSNALPGACPGGCSSGEGETPDTPDDNNSSTPEDNNSSSNQSSSPPVISKPDDILDIL